MTTERELLPCCPFCGGEAKLAAHPGAGRGIFHRGETVYSIDCGRTFTIRR